eukprot:TRINITY_DN6554_c0_g1_i4.p1 TRINITY_DN6554_c0_g1~~TRINITY_DN6554_c0_g1_i4.p1  ORF type:complete len:266 (-),score=69.90 TRINITY_DN6554_c0_g1_i4:124-813(-)
MGHDMDIQEINDLQNEHSHLQNELEFLESQFNSLLVRHKFMNALKEEEEEEGWATDEEIENLRRNIQNVKRERSEKEKRNRETLHVISSGIHHITENDEMAKILRERMKAELDNVKKQMADNSVASPRQVISPSFPDPSSASCCDYHLLYTSLSLLSGIKVLQIHQDHTIFELTSGKKTHRVTVEGHQRIDNVLIDPPFDVPKRILEYAKETNDRKFLLTEVLDSIRQG